MFSPFITQPSFVLHQTGIAKQTHLKSASEKLESFQYSLQSNLTEFNHVQMQRLYNRRSILEVHASIKYCYTMLHQSHPFHWLAPGLVTQSAPLNVVLRTCEMQNTQLWWRNMCLALFSKNMCVVDYTAGRFFYSTTCLGMFGGLLSCSRTLQENWTIKLCLTVDLLCHVRQLLLIDFPLFSEKASWLNLFKLTLIQTDHVPVVCPVCGNYIIVSPCVVFLSCYFSFWFLWRCRFSTAWLILSQFPRRVANKPTEQTPCCHIDLILPI